MSMSPGRLLMSRAQLLICKRAREPRTCVPPGRRTQTPESFLWRSISSLLVPDAVAVEHAGEGCRQYRPLREVAVLKDPHIVFPGKAKLLGRCSAANIVPFGKGLCRAGLPKACYYRKPVISSPLGRNIVSSGKLGSASFIVLPGNLYRLGREGMSSRLGTYVVLYGKMYRPVREIGSPFLLQKCGFLTIFEASVLYLSVVI